MIIMDWCCSYGAAISVEIRIPDPLPDEAVSKVPVPCMQGAHDLWYEINFCPGCGRNVTSLPLVRNTRRNMKP